MKGPVERDIWHETGEGGRKTRMTKAQPTNGYYCPSTKTGEVDKPRIVRERRLSAKVAWMVINIVNEMCGPWLGVTISVVWVRGFKCDRRDNKGAETGVDRANSSAISFTGMPACSGTQMKLVLQLWKWRRYCSKSRMKRIRGVACRLNNGLVMYWNCHLRIRNDWYVRIAEVKSYRVF